MDDRRQRSVHVGSEARDRMRAYRPGCNAGGGRSGQDDAVSAEDLPALPAEVQASARVLDNGEVMWPADYAGSAIDALAEGGFIVLGLDVRDYHDDGRFVECPWSDFRPTGRDDAARDRQAALDALGRSPLPGQWVLVTW